MTFDTAALSERERLMLDKLVRRAARSSRCTGSRGIRTVSPLEVAGDRTPGREAERRRILGQKVRHMLWIQGSRFDLLDEHKPFVGDEPMAPGRTLYPKDLSRAEFEAYVAAHPEQKAALYDEHTVVTRGPNKTLVATPYHVVYKPYLERAAADLRAAAELSDDALFKKFLTLRAEALLTDDYLASDLAWLDLQNPKFDIIFAPYETYLDDFLGVKTSVGRGGDGAQRSREQEARGLPEVGAGPPGRVAARARGPPVEARPGGVDGGHGHAVSRRRPAPRLPGGADNLPNDPRVHEKKGSKRIFFKNYTDARVDYVILPVAKLLMNPADAALASGEGYLTAVMMHEICHGLGPAYARQQDGGAGPEGKMKQVDIRVAIGPAYSGLEEAKADIVGMWGLHHMAANGGLAKERLAGIDASFVAGIFRTVRFGTAEAHGKAEMMEFNYFVEKGALVKQGGAMRSTRRSSPRPWRRSPRSCSRSRPPAIARAPRLVREVRRHAGGSQGGARRRQGHPVDIDPQQPYPELAP
jgi:hypothetical protein